MPSRCLSALDPTRIDSDGDGLTDAAEAKAGSAFDIDPGTAIGAPAGGGIDADRDGLTDAFEQLSGSAPDRGRQRRGPAADAVEAALGTNPLLGDTDADGCWTAPRSTTASDPWPGSGPRREPGRAGAGRRRGRRGRTEHRARGI